MAFLLAEYKILVYFVVAVAVLLGIFLNISVAITFVCGAVTSAVAGNVGMRIATKANGRTSIGAKEGGLSKALDVAFAGGADMGLAVVGLGNAFTIYYDNYIQLGYEYCYWIWNGASSIALFARVGGGIYTKRLLTLEQTLLVK